MKKEITKQKSNDNKPAQLTHTGKQVRAISELFRDPNIKTAYTITTLMTHSKEEPLFPGYALIHSQTVLAKQTP
jgi:hypothetical protein